MEPKARSEKERWLSGQLDRGFVFEHFQPNSSHSATYSQPTVQVEELAAARRGQLLVGKRVDTHTQIHTYIHAYIHTYMHTCAHLHLGDTSVPTPD